MVIAGTLSVPAFAINLQPGFDTGPLAASQVTPSCQNWSKNLSCADNNQQAVDDVVDQLSSGGGQANLSLIKGTYSDGDVCTYTASGTLLNCNTPTSTWLASGKLGTVTSTDFCHGDGSGNVVCTDGSTYVTGTPWTGLYLPLGGGTLTGDLALTTHNITMTGSLGATGAGKLTKGWFTDLEITNLPTINGSTLASALGNNWPY